MMSDERHTKYDSYVAAYDAAQRLSSRLAAEAVETNRQTDIYASYGRALYQIKELARAGFLLLPEATEEKFEQLWRAAFQLAAPEHEGREATPPKGDVS